MTANFNKLLSTNLVLYRPAMLEGDGGEGVGLKLIFGANSS